MAFSILVVDDDDAFRKSFCELLQLDGFSVAAARDEIEAISLMRGLDNLSATVIDLQLGSTAADKSGLELVRYMRQSRSELTIAIYSGTPESQDVITAFSFGANVFFSKGGHTYDDITRYLKKL